MPDINNQPSTPAGPLTPVTPVAPPEQTQNTPKKPKLAFLNNKKNKLFAMIAVVVLVLVGSSAAAYYGVVIPNKPENVLKTAIEKQLKKEQSASKGSISVDTKQEESSIQNVTVTFKSALDNTKQAFSADIEAAVSGAKLPLEIRSIDKSFYFKVGDLSSVKGLAAVAGGEQASAFVGAIGDKLSNKWIEIDESLLKQANAECTTNLVGGFSQKDIDEIMKVYSDNAFVNIKNKSADQIDGKDATKFELGLDTQKAAEFSTKLGNVEVIKKINECGKTTTGQDSGDTEITDELKDVNMTLNVWVDSGKNLRQIEVKSTDENADITALVTFTDDKVDIQKPEGAKPLMEILGDFGQLFGGANPMLSQNPIANDDTLDDMSEECKTAITAYAASGGTADIPTNCL